MHSNRGKGAPGTHYCGANHHVPQYRWQRGECAEKSIAVAPEGGGNSAGVNTTAGHANSPLRAAVYITRASELCMHIKRDAPESRFRSLLASFLCPFPDTIDLRHRTRGLLPGRERRALCALQLPSGSLCIRLNEYAPQRRKRAAPRGAGLIGRLSCTRASF